MDKDRIDLIKKQLVNKHQVTIAQLSREFKVTDQTIRRDLNQLESEGFINRTYGGAVLSNQKDNVDIPFYRLLATNKDKKDKIATLLANKLKDIKTVFVDSGSTVVNAASYLRNSNITIVTNSPEVAREHYIGNTKVIVIGGNLNRYTLSFQGITTEKLLNNYNTDVALISCTGVSLTAGVTDVDDTEDRLKEVMIKNANKVFLLVDSTKFDQKSFFKLMNLSDVDMILTDQKPDKQWLDYLAKNKIKIAFPDQNKKRTFI